MEEKSYEVYTPKAKDFLITAIGAISVMGILVATLIFLARTF